MTSTFAHKWNPLRMEARDLRALFVGRQVPLDYLVDQVRRHTRGPSMQHFVVTGRWGVGKTAFLRMVRLRVEEDPALARAWAPVTFPEETYAVYGLGSLFEVLRGALAGEHPASFPLEAASGAGGEAASAEEGIAALEAACAAAGRQVLLFLDNLDLLLEMIPLGRERQRLKAFLETTRHLLLVAGATELPEALTAYDEPLFGHLAPIPLEPLDRGEQEEMFRAYARWSGWNAYLDNPARYAPRLRAAADLTGGNPRLLLLLLEMVRSERFVTGAGDLDAVLDQLTPYYQALFRGLPPKERALLDRMLQPGGPRTPGDASRALGWSPQEVSVLLGRLRERGLLRRERRGRRAYFAPADGMLGLYHEMRHLPPGTGSVPSLARFLEAWHGLDPGRTPGGEGGRPQVPASGTGPNGLEGMVHEAGGEPGEEDLVLHLLETGREADAYSAFVEAADKLGPRDAAGMLGVVASLVVAALRLGKTRFVLDVLDYLEDGPLADTGLSLQPLRRAARYLAGEEELLLGLSDPERRAVEAVLERAGFELPAGG